MNHWLVKQEPEDYAFAQFVEDKYTDWTGVRNFQARNNLRAMEVGDTVLYYHSGGERAIVGTAKVSRAAFPDPTMEADEEKGQWIAVELRADRALKNPLPLAAVKADALLKNMVLAKKFAALRDAGQPAGACADRGSDGVTPGAPRSFAHAVGVHRVKR